MTTNQTQSSAYDRSEVLSRNWSFFFFLPSRVLVNYFQFQRPHTKAERCSERAGFAGPFQRGLVAALRADFLGLTAMSGSCPAKKKNADVAAFQQAGLRDGAGPNRGPGWPGGKPAAPWPAPGYRRARLGGLLALQPMGMTSFGFFAGVPLFFFSTFLFPSLRGRARASCLACFLLCYGPVLVRNELSVCRRRWASLGLVLFGALKSGFRHGKRKHRSGRSWKCR